MLFVRPEPLEKQKQISATPKSLQLCSFLMNQNPIPLHRYRMIGYRSKQKLSVTRLINIIFPELPSFVWSIHQASSYKLLLDFPSPEAIANCHLTRLTGVLSKASHGRYGKERAIQLRELATNSIGSSNRSLTFELQQTIRLIQSVQSETDELDKQIKLVVNELNTPLMTIPGIGYTIAAIILAEIGDINNFSSPAKLLEWNHLHISRGSTALLRPLWLKEDPHIYVGLLCKPQG